MAFAGPWRAMSATSSRYGASAFRPLDVAGRRIGGRRLYAAVGGTTDGIREAIQLKGQQIRDMKVIGGAPEKVLPFLVPTSDQGIVQYKRSLDVYSTWCWQTSGADKGALQPLIDDLLTLKVRTHQDAGSRLCSVKANVTIPSLRRCIYRNSTRR